MQEHGLSERKKHILKAIIDAHIAYGEPVGSKFLSNDKQLACSSATIRNEMAELEALGYLEQPHTSAGRVPSELGYRFYVDGLLDDYSRTRYEIEQMNLSLRNKLTELDQILAEASKIAASVTNYTALALKARPSAVKVNRFECVYIDSRSFLLIMLFNNTAKTKTIHLSFRITPDVLTRLSLLLNSSFVNVTADEILLSEIMRLEEEMGENSAIVTPIVKAIHETMKELDGGDVRVEGVNKLLQYPEYSDVSDFRDLLGVLEEKDKLLDVISTTATGDDDIQVYIGADNEQNGMKNTTLILKNVTIGGKQVSVGVIGPKRMNYSKVIDMLNKLAGGLDRIFTEDALPPGSDDFD